LTTCRGDISHDRTESTQNRLTHPRRRCSYPPSREWRRIITGIVRPWTAGIPITWRSGRIYCPSGWEESRRHQRRVGYESGRQFLYGACWNRGGQSRAGVRILVTGTADEKGSSSAGAAAEALQQVLRRSVCAQSQRKGAVAPCSWTPQESQVESCEHQDDSNIHCQPFPESVSEEHEIYTDYDGCHRHRVKHDSYLSAHFSAWFNRNSYRADRRAGAQARIFGNLPQATVSAPPQAE
jgi:hypothetical protein